MASVKVAVRVRPLNQRELDLNCSTVISMQNNNTLISNNCLKLSTHGAIDTTSKEEYKQFTFDHSYWSVNPEDSHYTTQEKVFADLGLDVVNNAYEGYNACLFAYGQTGSGKTYTMMGNPGDVGLIPRIGEELFSRMKDSQDVTYRTEVSYLEIYNEKVRDLLRGKSKLQHSLRVREHPKEGPYVQDLSRHLVMNFSDIKELMDKGNATRTTAATCMNDVSSRSHAIFTVLFTQATFSQDSPSETHSKIHLVDLAGSERASTTHATGQRLKEGGSINKSLVALGNVISSLADMSDKENSRHNIFVPYRDSTLTWLLKDSLGGNAKTIMVANISPAACNYAETLSTLRYANRAKNIINKPMVNEDANVMLIRELRAEIERLRTLLGGHIDNIVTPKVQEKLHENEAMVKMLTDKWTGKWKQVANILQEDKLALRKEGIGVVLDSELPHLIGIDDDILSTGIMLYHLKVGKTTIGTEDAAEKPDIVLAGIDLEAEHCIIGYNDGKVMLVPSPGAICTVNGVTVTESCQLSQGAVILLGKTNMFRFNYPAQAAKLRQKYKRSSLSLSRVSLLSQSMSDIYRSSDNLALLNSDCDTQVVDVSDWDSSQQVALQAAEQEASERRCSVQQAQREASLCKANCDQMERRRQDEVATLSTKEQQISTQLENTESLVSHHNRPNTDGAECQAGHEMLAERCGRLRRAVEEEAAELGRAEREADGHADTTRAKLEKEVSALQALADEVQAECECEQLEEEMAAREARRRQRQEQVNSRREQLQHQEQALRQLEEEKAALEGLESAPGALPARLPALGPDSLLLLQPDLERVSTTRGELAARDTALYAAHAAREAAVSVWQRAALDELAEEERRLAADTLYLDDCAAQLRAGQTSRAALQREADAMRVERRRVQTATGELGHRRHRLATELATRGTALQAARSQELEALNHDRDRLSAAERDWRDLAGAEASTKEVECATMTAALDADRRVVAEMERWEGEGEGEEEAGWLRERAGRREAYALRVLAAARERLGEVDEDQDAQRARFNSRRRTLSGLELPSDESVILMEDELNVKQQLFDEYISQKEAELRESMEQLQDRQRHLQQLHASQLLQMEAEQSELEQRLERLETAAAAARRDEATLVSRRDQAAAYRRRRLSIGGALGGGFQEGEGRLSGVVRTHVRRTLAARTQQQRATQQHALERVQEQHQRELAQLRSQYEEGRMPQFKRPTKANPYASTMNGDATNTHNSASNSRLSRSHESALASECSSLLKPIVVSIPSYVHRGSGFDSHFEYELKFSVMGDTWTIFRRYARFRQMHNDLKAKYPEVAILSFPPKRWFGNRLERIVVERRWQLEDYLQKLLDLLHCNITCPLHPSRNKVYSKHVLYSFHTFFRKGVFEMGRYETG